MYIVPQLFVNGIGTVMSTGHASNPLLSRSSPFNLSPWNQSDWATSKQRKATRSVCDLSVFDIQSFQHRTGDNKKDLDFVLSFCNGQGHKRIENDKIRNSLLNVVLGPFYIEFWWSQSDGRIEQVSRFERYGLICQVCVRRATPTLTTSSGIFKFWMLYAFGFMCPIQWVWHE